MNKEELWEAMTLPTVLKDCHTCANFPLSFDDSPCRECFEKLNERPSIPHYNYVWDKKRKK